MDAGRLWAGGVATAVVAALLSVTGVLAARGLFEAPIIAPQGAGAWKEADAAWYAFGAALLSLAATGLMHLLMRFTPRPGRFFAWVVGLSTALATLAPFVTTFGLASKLLTAALNLVLGMAIGSLIAGTARSARTTRARP